MTSSAVHWLQAAAVLAAYVLLCRVCLGGLVAGWSHQRAKPCATLVAYASQGGEAEALARRHAERLSRREPVALLPLNRVQSADLAAATRVLFIVSTYGEGEPPDNALRFARQWLGQGSHIETALSHLHFAVLALGDRDYRHFCGFGLALQHGLSEHGALPLFDVVCVDRMDQHALGSWQAQLWENAILEEEQEVLQAAAAPALMSVTLTSRQCLNEGSPGGLVFLLSFSPPPQAQWQPGDIAVLSLGDVQREYSIASLRQDGVLELVVRQVRKDDGSFGLGSGWLTQGIREGEKVTVQVRDNPAFHSPPPERPMILIGNGTGIAGLRAHLHAREHVGAHANWLIFGERTRACDRLFDDELSTWAHSGHLEQLDRVYSRDSDLQPYVQDKLALELPRLLQWLERDAAIYVCGSLQGMAPAVHRLLLDVLGERGLEDLILEGRYRRDVY